MALQKYLQSKPKQHEFKAFELTVELTRQPLRAAADVSVVEARRYHALLRSDSAIKAKLETALSHVRVDHSVAKALGRASPRLRSADEPSQAVLGEQGHPCYECRFTTCIGFADRDNLTLATAH